jgi:hypothetical protein
MLFVDFKDFWCFFLTRELLLEDDQSDDPSDMASMELGILAPVKTNQSYICLEELRITQTSSSRLRISNFSGHLKK